MLSSEQHAEMGKTRKEGNYKDLLILYDQLSTHSPFNAVGDRLRSICSRIKVPNNISLINCDNMEQIEEAIKTDRIFLHAAKIKSKSKVQPINSLYDTVVIKEEKYINLKPTVLFTWLTAVAQRKDD